MATDSTNTQPLHTKRKNYLDSIVDKLNTGVVGNWPKTRVIEVYITAINIFFVNTNNTNKT